MTNLPRFENFRVKVPRKLPRRRRQNKVPRGSYRYIYTQLYVHVCSLFCIIQYILTYDLQILHEPVIAEGIFWSGCAVMCRDGFRKVILRAKNWKWIEIADWNGSIIDGCFRKLFQQILYWLISHSWYLILISMRWFHVLKIYINGSTVPFFYLSPAWGDPCFLLWGRTDSVGLIPVPKTNSGLKNLESIRKASKYSNRSIFCSSKEVCLDGNSTRHDRFAKMIHIYIYIYMYIYIYIYIL